MSTREKTNPRVVIDIWSGYTHSDAAQETNALIVKTAIEKHIKKNDYPYNGINIEHNFQCGHCKSKWTERSTEYNGGCCAEDEKNNPKPEAA